MSDHSLRKALQDELAASPDDLATRRGWADSLEINRLSLALARALRDAPQARLLRHLGVDDAEDEETPLPDDEVPENENQRGFWPLVGSAALANLRSFRMGIDD